MEVTFNKLFGALMLFCLIGTTSCKKNDDKDLDFGFGGKSEISMDVDGKPWKANFAYTMTIPPEEGDNEDYYIVTITGTEVEIEAEETVEGAQGLTIWFAIPKSKFKSPKGEYLFTDMGVDDIDTEYSAFAMFYHSDNNNEVHAYSTLGDEGTSGSITIQDFKIGKQEFLGQFISDDEGYTELSGTFSMKMHLYSSETEDYKSIDVTNGKFNVNSGFSLGGLFGQFPEVEKQLEKLR